MIIMKQIEIFIPNTLNFIDILNESANLGIHRSHRWEIMKTGGACLSKTIQPDLLKGMTYKLLMNQQIWAFTVPTELLKT